MFEGTASRKGPEPVQSSSSSVPPPRQVFLQVLDFVVAELEGEVAGEVDHGVVEDLAADELNPFVVQVNRKPPLRPFAQLVEEVGECRGIGVPVGLGLRLDAADDHLAPQILLDVGPVFEVRTVERFQPLGGRFLQPVAALRGSTGGSETDHQQHGKERPPVQRDASGRAALEW